jgi:UTP-glucose-1-phosphate uridylyltransferase
MKPTLLVLAAGMGSRYGGLKQVDELGPYGEALIEYSVYDAIRAGFGKVVFVIRQNIADVFKEKVGNKLAPHIEVAYAFQEVDSPIAGLDYYPDREKPWGTAHAVLVAEGTISEPFAVINADDYYGYKSFADMAHFLINECTPVHHSMVGYSLPLTLSENGTVSRGVCTMNQEKYLTSVVERMSVGWRNEKIFCEESGTLIPLENDALVSMNFWGFHPAIFQLMTEKFIQFVAVNGNNPKSEFFIPLVINEGIQENLFRVKVIPSLEKWYGVTYKEDKEPVQLAFKEMTKEGIYPAPLWK